MLTSAKVLLSVIGCLKNFLDFHPPWHVKLHFHSSLIVNVLDLLKLMHDFQFPDKIKSSTTNFQRVTSSKNSGLCFGLVLEVVLNEFRQPKYKRRVDLVLSWSCFKNLILLTNLYISNFMFNIYDSICFLLVIISFVSRKKVAFLH